MFQNILEMKGVAVLSDSQKRKIKGSGGTCGAYLPPGAGIGNDTEFSPPYPSTTGGSGQPTIIRGASKDAVKSLTQGIPGARWCCESCSGTSWY